MKKFSWNINLTYSELINLYILISDVLKFVNGLHTIDKDLKKKSWLKITVTINLTSALFTDIFYHYDYTFFTLELLEKLRKFNILNRNHSAAKVRKKRVK